MHGQQRGQPAAVVRRGVEQEAGVRRAVAGPATAPNRSASNSAARSGAGQLLVPGRVGQVHQVAEVPVRGLPGQPGEHPDVVEQEQVVLLQPGPEHRRSRSPRAMPATVGCAAWARTSGSRLGQPLRQGAMASSCPTANVGEAPARSDRLGQRDQEAAGPVGPAGQAAEPAAAARPGRPRPNFADTSVRISSPAPNVHDQIEVADRDLLRRRGAQPQLDPLRSGPRAPRARTLGSKSAASSG